MLCGGSWIVHVEQWADRGRLVAAASGRRLARLSTARTL